MKQPDCDELVREMEEIAIRIMRKRHDPPAVEQILTADKSSEDDDST